MITSNRRRRNAKRKPERKVTPERKLLGERLLKIRESRGLTQKQVAGQLGCVASNISLFENGFHSPSFPRLRALARLFGCSVDELTDVGAPYPGVVSATHKD